MHDASAALAYDRRPASEVQSDAGGELTRMTTKRPKKKASTGAAKEVEHPMPFIRDFGEFFETWIRSNYPNGRPEPEDVHHFIEGDAVKRARRRDWEAMRACLMIGSVMSSGHEEWEVERIAEATERHFSAKKKQAKTEGATHLAKEAAFDELADLMNRTSLWFCLRRLGVDDSDAPLWQNGLTVASAAMIAMKRRDLDELERRGNRSMVEHAKEYLTRARAKGERQFATLLPAYSEREVGEELLDTTRLEWPVYFADDRPAMTLEHAVTIAHVMLDCVRTNLRLAPFVRRYGGIWTSSQKTRAAERDLGRFILGLSARMSAGDIDAGTLKLTRKLLSVLGVKKPENYLRH